MTTYHHTSPGHTGLVHVTTFYALCLCGTYEVEALNVLVVEKKLKEEGWTNGHEPELAPLPGAQGEPTEWRCPECEVPCPRCRPDLRGEIYANRAKIGEVCDLCDEEIREENAV